MKSKSSKFTLVFLALIAAVIIAQSFRVNEIPHGNINTCANCHFNPAGGGARNAFGTEVENNFLTVPGPSGHVQWGPELAALDSDGDGFTNGEELQDPNGEWRPGNPLPGHPAFVTNPGDPNSFPVVAIIVLSPNGGESFEPDQQTEITWASNLIDDVTIEFTSDNGGSWSEVINSTPSNGSYIWTIPNISSTQCRIRIVDVVTGTSDQSNSTFTISQPLNPSITVTSPNGGENWQAGSLQTITWNSVDVSTVSISFTTNNGTTWNEIINTTVSNGSFNWNIPENINSTLCRVRVMDNDSIVQDESDETFTIFTPLNPEITVTSPNGGEELQTGAQFEITWISNDVNNVLIELSTDNGNAWNEIVASTESDGSYLWTVPNISSDECLVRISDIESNAFDQSDNVFTIFDPTSVIDDMKLTFNLSQNYPNPFNPTTAIQFQIPKLSDVVLKIYSSTGELVKILVDQPLSPGQHHVVWNGKNQFGQNVVSGVYIYQLKSDQQVETKQMILMK